MHETKDQNETKENNPISLSDILIDKNDPKHQYSSNFIRDATSNWKKNLKLHKVGHTDPDCIIPNWFYLGNKVNASDKDCLLKYGITHILNVTGDTPCYFVNDITYAQCSLDDDLSENISKYFKAANEFINTVNPKYNQLTNNNQNNKLLVHCAVGKSRSATVVIQYLMKNGIDFNNDKWLKKIESFGLKDNFINDDRLYKRSLSCFNINNILCCNWCLCFFKCCFCCNCCNENKILMNGLDMKIDCDIDPKYEEWKRVCNINTMSLRNSCDYVQKCRDIICPNNSFLTQLAIIEESLRNGISTFDKMYIKKHGHHCGVKVVKLS